MTGDETGKIGWGWVAKNLVRHAFREFELSFVGNRDCHSLDLKGPPEVQVVKT